jgi:ABC-type branched-subunit amino acid transport system ATPase component
MTRPGPARAAAFSDTGSGGPRPAGPGSASTTLLRATGIDVRFGGLQALRNVDIEIGEPGIYGLLGPNGAGKTTLFSVLSGLLRPSGGSVFLDGVDVSRWSPQARVRRGLARTFQQPELFQDLTVEQHLLLAHRMRHAPAMLWLDYLSPRNLRGGPRPAERDRIRSLMHTVGISDIAGELAIGQPIGRARLIEFARALALGPSLILLDEPSSGLGPQDTAELERVLADVAASGVALLLVEHDVQLVLRLSREVFVLDFGAIIARGTPEEIAADPHVQTAYLGDPVSDDGPITQEGPGR